MTLLKIQFMNIPAQKKSSTELLPIFVYILITPQKQAPPGHLPSTAQASPPRPDADDIPSGSTPLRADADDIPSGSAARPRRGDSIRCAVTAAGARLPGRHDPD